MTTLRDKPQCAWSDEEFLAGWDQEDLELYTSFDHNVFLVRRIKQTGFPTFRSISVSRRLVSHHLHFGDGEIAHAARELGRCHPLYQALLVLEFRQHACQLRNFVSSEMQWKHHRVARIVLAARFGCERRVWRRRATRALSFPRPSHLSLNKGGRWFILSYPKVRGCSTCEGQTESSFRVREFLCLHDLVWAGLDDEERDGLIYIEQFDTYEEFRHTISRTLLKKVIFS
jgi:hypothetical protein